MKDEYALRICLTSPCATSLRSSKAVYWGFVTQFYTEYINTFEEIQGHGLNMHLLMMLFARFQSCLLDWAV